MISREREELYRTLEELPYVKDSLFTLHKGNYGNFRIILIEKKNEELLIEHFDFDNSMYIISAEYDSYRKSVPTLEELQKEINRLMNVILLRVRTSLEDKYSIL